MRRTRHVRALRATALSVAWEQIACWQNYMTRIEVCMALTGTPYGFSSWEKIATRLADLWIELQSTERELEAA